MKKLGRNLFIIIPCFLVLIAAVVVMCVLFIPNGEKDMTLDVKDVVVVQGESKQIEIQCSNPNAKIEFDIYDDLIASVSENKVFGIKIGTTKMRVTASYNDARAVSIVTIKVTENFSKPLVDLPESVELFLLDKNIEQANNDGYFNKIMFETFRPHTVSGEEGIVKVENGSITALKVGTTTLIFNSTTTTDAYSVKVTVGAVTPKIVCEEQVEMFAKEEHKISYSFLPSYYTGDIPKVEFTCSSNLVSFSEDVMTANHSGTCVVDVLVGDEKQAEINVTIKILFDYNIEPNRSGANCKYENGCLMVLRGEKARFTIEVTALKGSLNSDEWSVRSDDFVCTREVAFITLTALNDGEIEIYSDTLVSSVTIKVIIVESL